MPPRRAGLGVIAAALLLTSGCATLVRRPQTPRPLFAFRSAVRAPGAKFEIWYDAVDEQTVTLVRAALQQAAPRITRWGKLRYPVVIRLYPSHDALEAAVHRFGYGWLRAWARYDEVFLQSPRTFTAFERGEANVAELLTHELTHCLMYQLAAEERRWRRVDRMIPIWFREGMASWTADQGKRRVSEARLTGWLRTEHHNPLAEAAALYRDEATWIYGASHWTFAFLVERYGVARVQALLASLKAGNGFGQSFEGAVGLSQATFSEDLLRYLLWEGWRGRGHPDSATLFRAAPTSSSAEPSTASASAMGGARPGRVRRPFAAAAARAR